MRVQMNLEELSDHLQIPKEELVRWLREHLHIILLSEVAPIASSTLETVLAYFQNHEEEEETDDTEEPEEQTPSAPLPSQGDTPGAQKTIGFMEDCMKRNFLLMVDTCSIMGEVKTQSSTFFPFIERITPLLRRYGKKLVIPYIVYSEIAWFRDNVPQKPKGRQAAWILPELEQLGREGLVIFAGDRSDWPRSIEKPFADDCLCSKASSMRTNGRNVLVITQDRNLTSDLKAIMSKRSVTTEAEILVRRLDKQEGILLAPSRPRKEK